MFVGRYWYEIFIGYTVKVANIKALLREGNFLGDAETDASEDTQALNRTGIDFTSKY